MDQLGLVNPLMFHNLFILAQLYKMNLKFSMKLPDINKKINLRSLQRSFIIRQESPLLLPKTTNWPLPLSILPFSQITYVRKVHNHLKESKIYLLYIHRRICRRKKGRRADNQRSVEPVIHLNGHCRII